MLDPLPLEEWRSLVEHWTLRGKNLIHLEIPLEIAQQLNLKLSEEDMARRKAAAVKKQEIIETEGETVPQAGQAPTWKRKAYFDGTECGFAKCTRAAVGYIAGKKPTKSENPKAVWYGPVCAECCKQWSPALQPLTLWELLTGRTESEVALMLDIEVGQLKERMQSTMSTANEALQQVREDVAHEAQLYVQKRWRDDASFVAALAQRQYIGPAGELYMHEGSYLYMYEAFCDGRAWEPSPPAQLPLANPVPQGVIHELAPTPGAITLVVDAVVIPRADLDSKMNYAMNTLKYLETWEVYTQPQIDEATTFLQQISLLHKTEDETRLKTGASLRAKLDEVNDHWREPLKLLLECKNKTKDMINRGMQRAAAVAEAAYYAAQQAYQQGNMPGVAMATQQATSADVHLPSSLSGSVVAKWKWGDVRALPTEFWSWVPDGAKVQAAVDAGHRSIPGVEIWEESKLTVRQPR